MSSHFELMGKVALVTGGNGGVGSAWLMGEPQLAR
jgi:hypothetical protein